MTCIATINDKEKDYIEYGADTLVTEDGLLEFPLTKTKIIKKENYVVLPTFACSGSMDIINEITDCLDECIKNGKELRKELPKRYKRLSDENFVFHASDDDKKYGYRFALILVFPFGVFEMTPNACNPWCIERKYFTNGSGKFICYGALLTDKVSLKEALEISCVSSGVGGKIQVGKMKRRDATDNESKALSFSGLAL